MNLEEYIKVGFEANYFKNIYNQIPDYKGLDNFARVSYKIFKLKIPLNEIYKFKGLCPISFGRKSL